MLVIRRHAGQTIQIGDAVEVLVIDCGQGRVKLGIRAPKNIPVVRGEVTVTREQNLTAAHAIEVGQSFELPVVGRTFGLGAIQGSQKRADKQQ